MLSGDMSVPRPELVRIQPTGTASPPPAEVQPEPFQEALPAQQPEAPVDWDFASSNEVRLPGFTPFEPVQPLLFENGFNLNAPLRNSLLTPGLTLERPVLRFNAPALTDTAGATAQSLTAPAEPASEIPQVPESEADSAAAAVPEPLSFLPDAEGLSSSRTVLRGEQLESRLSQIQAQITSGLERLSQLPEGEARNAAQQRLTELQNLINNQASAPDRVAQLQQHMLSQDTTSEGDISFHERLTEPHTDNGEPLADPVDNLYGRRTDAALRDYIERLANVSPEASAPEPEAVVENPPVEGPEEPTDDMPGAAEPVEETPASEREPETEVAEHPEDVSEAGPGSGSPPAPLTVQEANDAQDIPARLEAIDQEIENLGGRTLLRKFAENEDLIMAASRVRSGLTQAENEPLLQQSGAVSDFQDWIRFNEGFFESNPEHREALQGLMAERIQLMLSQQREQMSSEGGASLAQISFEPFSYQAFLQPATYIEWGPVDLFNPDATMMA